MTTSFIAIFTTLTILEVRKATLIFIALFYRKRDRCPDRGEFGG